MQQNIFNDILYAVLYRGLSADTFTNPVNSLISILSEDYTRLNPDFAHHVPSLIEQLYKNKNHFIDTDMLNDVCRTFSAVHVDRHGISIDILAKYLSDNIFHYGSFVEEFNLILCKHALLVLDREQYTIITESRLFKDDVYKALWDNVQDNLMRKRKMFDEFISHESSKLSEEEKLINKQFYLTNE